MGKSLDHFDTNTISGYRYMHINSNDSLQVSTKEHKYLYDFKCYVDKRGNGEWHTEE